MRKLTRIYVDDDIHRVIKVFAAEKGLSMPKAVEELVDKAYRYDKKKGDGFEKIF